jgi:serine beta-lactamase-like protein LACTB
MKGVIKKIILGLLVCVLALIALAFIFVFLARANVPDQTPPPISFLHDSNYTEVNKHANDWLQANHQKLKGPSFSAAIGVGGELVWEGVVGYADLESETLATRETQYRIGSVSKPISAVAIMSLQEQGLIDIDTQFSEIVDDYPTENTGFTLRQLLAHQAGIRHYQDMLSENLRNEEFSVRREAAAIVENDPLLFTPGEGYKYTTYGYTLLATAMEYQTGKSLEDIIQAEVFEPAKMGHSKFDKSRSENLNDKAKAYLEIKDKLYKAPKVNLSYKYAGGGYLSTPSDLIRFANALMGDAMLSPSSKQDLWTPVRMNNGEMSHDRYALGFFTGEDELGHFVSHGGKGVGGYAFFIFYPDSGISVAFATNFTPANDFDRKGAALDLVRIFTKPID